MAQHVGRKVKRAQRKETKKEKADAEAARVKEFWSRQVPELEIEARQARERASHYGGFTVGGAALVRCASAYFTVSGANHKGQPGPRLQCDHCAEEELEKGALEEAQRRGFKCEDAEVVGFVIIAPPKVDDFSDFDFGVTISCGHDRRRWRSGEYLGPIKGRSRGYYINAEQPARRVELTVETILALTAKRDACK